ncbi:MAG TPA: hypothetical protein VFG22_13265 [Polyangiales bacterium]|nr:hypothetical protein [Polyangiales bacterium]
MLTAEDMARIVKEETLGIDAPTNETQEAAAFRVKTAASVAEVHSLGYEVEIPQEWPDISDFPTKEPRTGGA